VGLPGAPAVAGDVTALPSSGALLPLLMSPLAVAPCGAVAAPALPLRRAPDAARTPRVGAPPFVCAAACCARSWPACAAPAWAAAAAAERAAQLSAAGEAAAAPALPLPASPGRGAAADGVSAGAGWPPSVQASSTQQALRCPWEHGSGPCGRVKGNKRGSHFPHVSCMHVLPRRWTHAGRAQLLGSMRAPASARAGAHPTGRPR